MKPDKAGKNPSPEKPPAPKASGVEGLRAELRELCDEQSNVRAAIAELQLREKELTREIDLLAVRLEREDPRRPHAELVREYQERSKQIQAARVARERELLEAGAEPGEIVVQRAPIDTALAQRRKGTDRPELRRSV